ncbi:methionyl-tRNA formyltransferase [Ideonella livida]|uniref:Methionyl-tRNA formyltransferase n=1 Tax=Ideonella livida TaxID=2707176 RepID=A0A7C9PG94_9BURK|nr:methionyl-tRNA formyltransferase [Ideonella livida]NDY91136.1 methionyl-tRNA formyltransferase [Ideonella livida]
MRVGFAGTPEFAAVALQALLEAGFTVPLVLTQPDRPAGRGMKLSPSPVKQLALSRGIAVSQPRSLRLDGRWPEEAACGREALEAAGCDVLVVAAYGLILPAWVLTHPRLGCLNIHASLLPRWRGAAPIHRAIEAGDERTGIAIMQMDEGLDTGAVITAETQPIGPQDTTASLHDRLAAQGGRLIVSVLQRAAQGQPLAAQPQPAQGVCYAHKIEKGEAHIDWRLPADQLERRVRAFDPFPGASFACRGEVVKVWQARVLPGVGAEPGTVVQAEAGTVVVACGSGALALETVQRPGGRRMPVQAWLHALEQGGAALRGECLTGA